MKSSASELGLITVSTNDLSTTNLIDKREQLGKIGSRNN